MPSLKLTTMLSLSDIMKRVPPNQLEQFEEFRRKSVEYQRQVNKYPQQLPAIDWEYYRKNVRPDFVKVVKTFEMSYKELDQVFASHAKTLDFSKYFSEWKKESEQTKKEYDEFVTESNKRIECYKQELQNVQSLMPYEEMTFEDFVTLRPDLAQNVPRKGNDTYWPHTPEEQPTTEELPLIAYRNNFMKKLLKMISFLWSKKPKSKSRDPKSTN